MITKPAIKKELILGLTIDDPGGVASYRLFMAERNGDDISEHMKRLDWKWGASQEIYVQDLSEEKENEILAGLFKMVVKKYKHE